MGIDRQQPTIENSCDNCHDKKRRCDRILPKCSHCQTDNEPCTRNRIFNLRKPKLQRQVLNCTQVFSSKPKSTKLNSKKLQLERSRTNSRSSTSPSSPSNTLSNSQKVIRGSQIKTQTKLRLYKHSQTKLNLVKNDNSNNQVNRFNLDFYEVIKAVGTRNWTRYLMNVVFLLPLSSDQRNSSFNLFLGLVQLTVPPQYERSTIPQPSPQRPDSNLMTHHHTLQFQAIPPTILHQSLEAYLDNVNPYMPLFTKCGFYSRPRPIVLTSVLQASGMRFLTNPNQRHLSSWDFILQKRAQHLIRSHYHRPSLGVLQALLAIHFSFPGGDSDPEGGLSLSLTTVQCISLSMALQLGLHCSPPRHLNLSPELREERRLTYNAVLFVCHAHAWRMNVPSNPPPSYTTTDSTLAHHPILRTLTRTRSPSSPHKEDDLIPLMSDNLALEVWSFRKLQLLRHLIQTHKLSSQGLLEAIHDHLDQIRSGYNKLTSSLMENNLLQTGIQSLDCDPLNSYLLDESIVDNQAQLQVRRHLGYLAIICHSHIRAVNCLVLHLHEDTSLPPSTTPLPPRPSLDLTLAINSCARAVELALALCPTKNDNQGLPLPRIIPLTGLALAFLARHISYHPDPELHIGILGLGYKWLYDMVMTTTDRINFNNYQITNTTTDNSFELPPPSTYNTTWAQYHLQLVHHLIMNLISDHPELQPHLQFHHPHQYHPIPC